MKKEESVYQNQTDFGTNPTCGILYMTSRSAQLMRQRLQLPLRTLLRSSNQKQSLCRKLSELNVGGYKRSFKPYYRTAALSAADFITRIRLDDNTCLRVRHYRSEDKKIIVPYAKHLTDKERGLSGKSGKVVITAVVLNCVNFLVKLGIWLYSGSHSMFAECIHSLADMVNQLIQAYGIHKSVQTATYVHPYGYSNMKYVSSLISGVCIFCMGCSLSIYHGISGIINPEPMEPLLWTYFILCGAMISDGVTLILAITALRRAAKEMKMSSRDYVLSGRDPSVNFVLTEDLAGLIGIIIAGSCMGLSSYTGSPLYDAVGSILVGGVLGVVASFNVYMNVQALMGKTIPPARLKKINSSLEAEPMIRALQNVIGLDIGNSLVRYKAEVAFNGRELTRFYLDKHDLNDLMATVKSFDSTEQMESFLLDHGEKIVDLIGVEIDRIETKLIRRFPEIRYCDLEVY